MRLWLLLAAFLAAFAAPASARDWSGFYLGARAGYGSTDFDPLEQIISLYGEEFQVLTDPGTSISISEYFSLNDPTCGCAIFQDIETEGFTYGFLAGYGWQSGRFVFGVEAAATNASFSVTDISVGGFFDGQTSAGEADGDFAYGVLFDLDTILSLNGRVGMAFDRFLVFGTAGVATTRVRTMMGSDAAVFFDNGEDAFSIIDFAGSGQAFGWVLGAGFEYALTETYSVRIDYQHIEFVNFGLDGLTLNGPETRDIDFGVDLVTLGFNVSF